MNFHSIILFIQTKEEENIHEENNNQSEKNCSLSI